MTAEEEEWVEREPAWCISLGNGLSVQHTPEAEAHWQAVVDEDALADATDPRFTDGQRAQLARFEAAPIPAEVLLAHLEIDAALAPQAGEHICSRWCADHTALGGPLDPS